MATMLVTCVNAIFLDHTYYISLLRKAQRELCCVPESHEGGPMRNGVVLDT